jgi:hypothetical protein
MMICLSVRSFVVTQKTPGEMTTPFKKAADTGYYGADGGIMPLFSCGSQALAPSLLTGDGSHMALWASVLIHVTALALNLAANIVFFTSSHAPGMDLVWTWALFSLIAHILAVVGTLVYTGFVRNALTMPTVLTLGTGLFFGAIVATSKVSFAHSGMPADSTENVLYNLSVIFQVFGMASIMSNAIVAAANAGGI